MNKFYFGGGSGSVSSDDEDNLPYPEALPRSDFLAPDFDAANYLSTLSERHQTLEDLRSDLRERSQTLSKELLDLVNTNYERFLSLGSDLKGGEEKVEDARVGLLGFKRGVEDVKFKVRERKSEVEGLLIEKKGIAKDIALGRKLLELDVRMEDLEDRLMVASLGRTVNGSGEDEWSESEDEEEDEEEELSLNGTSGQSAKKLERLVVDFLYIEHLSTSIGAKHPFVVAQDARKQQVRNTLLLDLSTALKQAAAAGTTGQSKLIKTLSIYRKLGADSQAIKVLKDIRI